jgi:hypothetical protein
MGQKIMVLQSTGSDYDGVHKHIEVLCGFPYTSYDQGPFLNEYEQIRCRMISKEKDLRPMLVAILRDECEVAIRLPDADFQ